MKDLERALMGRRNIYRRGAELVRIRRLEDPVEGVGDRSGISSRQEGVVEIAAATHPWLTMELSRSGVPLVRIGGEKSFRTDVDAAAMKLRYPIGTADETAFPLLRGVSTTPTLDQDEPGYDSERGSFWSSRHTCILRLRPSQQEINPPG